ncbi:hypothetical protein WA158_000356 [Blastocystis sp. Blastoise]
MNYPDTAARRFLMAAKQATTGCENFFDGLCLNLIDGNFFGILVEIWLIFFCLVGVGAVVDAKLVPSLEALCDRWHMKEDVAGATFLAIGSAAPEIVISTITAIEGGDSLELGVSSIFGSGLMGFLVVPGLCAVCAPEALQIKRRALVRDCLVYGGEDHDEGGLHTNDEPDADGLLNTPTTPSTPIENKIGGSVSKTQTLLEKCMPHKAAVQVAYVIDMIIMVLTKSCTIPTEFFTKWTVPEPHKKNGDFSYIALITMLLSFVWIAIYSFITATIIERWCEILEEINNNYIYINISIYPNMVGLQSLFGLSVISWGSAVPDTIQSLAVAKKGLASMALANSIGSQIVNIGVGLGFPWLLMTFFDDDGNLPFGDITATMKTFYFHLTGMIVFFVLTIGCMLVFRQPKIILNKMKGIVLFVTYAVIICLYGLYAFGIFKF